jgi:hypothetical protein
MSLHESPAALRCRLFNPPNAVVDHPIDLSRYRVKPPVIRVADIPKPPRPLTAKERFDEACQNYFANIWAGALAWDRVLKEREADAPPPPPPATVNQIIRFVAREYDLSREDLLADRRTQNLVRPRHIAMWLAKTITRKSYPYIGLRFGNRDHTTILHGVRKIERERQTDYALQYQLDQFKSALRSPQLVEIDNAEDPAAISR